MNKSGCFHQTNNFAPSIIASFYPTGPLLFGPILRKSLRVEGFMFFSYGPEKIEPARKQLQEWIAKVLSLEKLYDFVEYIHYM